MTPSQLVTVSSQLSVLRQQPRRSTSPPPPPLSWSCHRCPQRGYYRFSAIRNRCLWCSHRFCLTCRAKTNFELFELWKSYREYDPEMKYEIERLEEMLLEPGTSKRARQPVEIPNPVSVEAQNRKTQDIKINIAEMDDKNSDAENPEDKDTDETNGDVTLCDTSFICFGEPIVMDDQSLLFTAFTTFEIKNRMQ